MRTLLALPLALALAAAAVADPLAYALPPGSTYTADMNVGFSPKAIGFVPVPGKSRQMQLHLTARADAGALALHVVRTEGPRTRTHDFRGTLSAQGPLAVDGAQFPKGPEDPEPACVAMGIVIALPVLPGGEAHPGSTWKNTLTIPVPPNKYVTVKDVQVCAEYKLKSQRADRVTVSVNAKTCDVPNPQITLSYDGDIDVDRTSGMPLSASLSGHFSRSDLTAVLARVSFSITMKASAPLVAQARSLLGIGESE